MTEGKKYPSVTTVLSVLEEKAWLEEWRNRIGADEADRIMRRGGARGTAMHDMCEKLVLNDPFPTKGHMPSNVALYSQVKPILLERLTEVYGVEIALYSDYIKVAGRCDLVGLFDSVASIIDYKTTNWAKDEEAMHGYFLQEALYAAMFSEMYGINIEQLVTISAGESEPKASVVIKQRSDWLPEAIKTVRKYYAQKA